MSDQSLGPAAVLDRAAKAVPVVKYAVGLTGVAAAIAIVRGLLPDVGFAAMLPILVGSIICMAVLLILAAAMRRKEAALVGTVFLWAVCLFVIAFMILTISAIAIGQPRAWAETILPKHTVVTETTVPPPTAAPPPAVAPAKTASAPANPAPAEVAATPPAAAPAPATGAAAPETTGANPAAAPASTPTVQPPLNASVTTVRVRQEMVRPIPSLSQALSRQFAMTRKAN